MRNWDSLEYEQKNLNGKWEASYAPKGFWKGVLALAKREVAPGLVPPRSPRAEALAQIKAAEKRQADGLVRPFSAAQYKRWSADPRPRPATYYDGSPRPDAGTYPQGSVDYVSIYREANNARGQLVRGAREPVKVKGKRKVATA